MTARSRGAKIAVDLEEQVSMASGDHQVAPLEARGGLQPRKSGAKSNPTVGRGGNDVADPLRGALGPVQISVGIRDTSKGSCPSFRRCVAPFFTHGILRGV